MSSTAKSSSAEKHETKRKESPKRKKPPLKTAGRNSGGVQLLRVMAELAVTSSIAFF